VFENRVFRISGPKRDEVTGDWRKLYEELYDLYYLPNIFSGDIENEMGGAYDTYGGEKRSILSFGGET